jgi:flagellar secretion chaperone FliS
MLRAYAKSQYEEMQVQTTPGRLVVMLYDGMLRFLQLGREALLQGDLQSQCVNLGKAQNILCELLETLDSGAGALAEQLDTIYRHWLKRLVIAHAEDRVDDLEVMIQQVASMREAWEQAERALHQPETAFNGARPPLVEVGA